MELYNGKKNKYEACIQLTLVCATLPLNTLPNVLHVYYMYDKYVIHVWFYDVLHM